MSINPLADGRGALFGGLAPDTAGERSAYIDPAGSRYRAT